MNRPAAHSLALMIFVLCASAAPRAGHAARLAVVVRGIGAGSDKAAAMCGYFARDYFSKDERYEVVESSKALGNPDRDRALKAFQVAEETMQKGREAYDTLELDAAVDYLQKTLAKYEGFAAYVADFKKVAEALMLLGATHVLRGEEKLGAKRLEQAISIYSKVEPDPRVFNPAMRSLFQQTIGRMGNRPPGSMALTSSPSYADAYVDGRFVGVTPIVVDNIGEGRHYVRLEKAGYRAWGRVADVTSRSESAESGVLKPTSHLDDFDRVADASVRRVGESGKSKGVDSSDQLATLMNVDQVFLAAVTLDGEQVQVRAAMYDASSQTVKRRVEHTFSYDSRTEIYEREIAAMLAPFGADQKDTSDDQPPPPNAKPQPTPKADGGGLPHAGEAQCWDMPCRKLKSYAIIGGSSFSAVAVGVGAFFWTRAQADYNLWRSQYQVNGNDTRSDGITEALVGDVLVGLGLAAAAATIVVAVKWDPSPTAEEVVGRNSGATTFRLAPLPGGGFLAAELKF